MKKHGFVAIGVFVTLCLGMLFLGACHVASPYTDSLPGDKPYSFFVERPAPGVECYIAFYDRGVLPRYGLAIQMECLEVP